MWLIALRVLAAAIKIIPLLMSFKGGKDSANRKTLAKKVDDLNKAIVKSKKANKAAKKAKQQIRKDGVADFVEKNDI